MIAKGSKLYWITKGDEHEVTGVEIYRVVSETIGLIVLKDENGKLHHIRTYNLGVRAFLDPNTARAIIETHKMELKALHEEQIERLDSELLKLEED